MCESTAYWMKNNKEEKIMDYVIEIIPKENGHIQLCDILGEEKTIKGKIKEVKLLDHKIMIEEN